MFDDKKTKILERRLKAGPRGVWLLCVLTAFVITFAGNHLGKASNPNPPEPGLPLPSPYFDIESYVETLDKNRIECPDEGCRWWYDYIKAKAIITSDQKSSCELFSRLSEKPDFPLHFLAFFYRAKSCRYDIGLSVKTLKKIRAELEGENLRPWGEEALAEGALEAALSGEQAQDVSRYAIKAAKLNRTKRNKIEILQRAVRFFKERDEKNTKESSPDGRSEVLAELYQVAPHLKPMVNPQAGDWTIFGLDALSVHDFKEASKAFEKIIKISEVPVQVRRMAYENLKTSYKALQRKEDAFKISKKLYFWELSLLKKKKTDLDEAKHVLSSGLTCAKSMWTEHKSRPALAFLKSLERNLKDTPVNMSELYFVRARINEELRKTKIARFWLRKAVEKADPALKGQYGWVSAWMSYKEGRFLDSQKELEQLQETEPDQGRRSQEIFWLAKSYESLKKPEAAKPWLEKIIQEDPLGYYSLVAYRELGRPIPKDYDMNSEIKSKIPRGETRSTRPLSPVFRWLVSTGEIRWAQELLVEDFPLPDPTVEIDLGAFLAYSQAAFFSPIFSRIAKIPPAEKERLLFQHSEFLFPQLYRDAVEQASGRSGMWPSYIFAIMRQESSFDPLSVSPANAYGLLQLLPNVAQALAAKSGIPYHQPDDLLDPTTNVMLGALHLRNYWEQFNGQFLLTTAAYNASPQSVKSWVRSRFRGDPLVFIEDIPYEETRVYVKLVLRNFIHYLRTSTESSSLNFPEWCLEGIHTSKK